MPAYRGKIDLVDMREIVQAGSLFTWVRYAEDINGKGISDNPEGKNYIGFAYNKTSPSPPPLSEEFTEEDLAKQFTWSLYKGENGINGIGIVKVETLYAASDNGIIPPLGLTGLTLVDNNTLAFKEEDGQVSFIVNNSMLKAQDADGPVLSLRTQDGYIIGAGIEWTETIPEVPSGCYLWTKTIYHYSNGEKTVHYASSYQGLDGQDANSFRLVPNQREVLKFFNEEEVIFSPEILSIAVCKEDIHSEKQEQITKLDINNFVIEIYNAYSFDGADWQKIDNSFITIDKNNNFIFDLKAYAAISKEGTDNNNPDVMPAYLLKETECILRIGYTHTENGYKGSVNTYNLNEFISVRYSMNKDMASLSVNAHNIVASMQDSKLIFGAHGLTVQNGAFKIVSKTEEREEELLYADNNGNLCLKGIINATGGKFSGELVAATGTFKGELVAATGNFKGEVIATAGKFSGEISANSGSIGGFEIKDGQLISTEDKDSGDNSGPSIVLDGKNGTIIAENITLGTGAVIGEYITIGKIDKFSQEGSLVAEQHITLRKPTKENNKFIEVIQKKDNKATTILSLSSEGAIQVGDQNNYIIIDGSTSTMMSSNFIEDGGNFGWKIANDNSIFNNVTVRGSIRASVLEYEEIQVIGGMLLVRPGSKILSESYDPTNNLTTLKVEDNRYFRKGDYCRLDSQTLTGEEQSPNEEKWVGIFQNWHKIVEIKKENIIIVSGKVTEAIGSSLVSFGQVDKKNNFKDNVGIFINGSSGESFFSPQAITVFETNFDKVTEANQQPELKRRVVLGRLPMVDWKAKNLAGSYGLYAENAYLKGALVTQFNNGSSYAGINTIYENEEEGECPTTKRYAEHFKDKTGAPVIFWGGANGFTKDEIEAATFLVDKNGNLVANSGYFDGTIISNATIKASVLETTKITGCGNDPALIIEDVNKGIVFAKTEKDKTSTSLFELNEDGIESSLPLKIRDNVGVKFSVSKDGFLAAANLSTKGIEVGDTYIQNITAGTKTTNSRIKFDQNGLVFLTEGKESLRVSIDKIEAQKTLAIEENVVYGNVIQYKPVKKGEKIIGYDLYVQE